MISIQRLFEIISVFYISYLIIFAIFSIASVFAAARKLYKEDIFSEAFRDKFDYNNFPVSILVPAHNEGAVIVENINSILSLDYVTYEIIIIDDGSTDKTAEILITNFKLQKKNNVAAQELKSLKVKSIYENVVNGVNVVLISKENGGKGDALNVGISYSNHPYFISMDADSSLKKDAIKEIIKPVFWHKNTVAVGGMILISQCTKSSKPNEVEYKLTSNLLVGLQAVEYNRSFFASRIFMDVFNGNLIISGAFGLFEKSTAILAGGYSVDNLGEDMELVMKIHRYCRNNKIEYKMAYQPNAICMTQAPMKMRDLMTQRRRWYLGLFQSMMQHKKMMLNFKFGWVSLFSYLYYLTYELLAPFIEIFGIITIVIASYLGFLNPGYMITFLVIYALFGAVVTLTSFSQIIYIQKSKITVWDMLKAFFYCIVEFVIFRYLLVFARLYFSITYKKRKNEWGEIERISK